MPKHRLFAPLLVCLAACSDQPPITDREAQVRRTEGPRIQSAHVLQAKDGHHPVVVTLHDDDGLVDAVRLCSFQEEPGCTLTAQGIWMRTGWVTLPRPLSQLGGATLVFHKQYVDGDAEVPFGHPLGRYRVSPDGTLRALPNETPPPNVSLAASVTGESTLLVVVRTKDKDINRQFDDCTLTIQLPTGEDPDCGAREGKCGGGRDDGGRVIETTFPFTTSQRLAEIDQALPVNACFQDVHVIAETWEEKKGKQPGVKSKQLDRALIPLGCPFEGPGAGIAAVPTDDDPRTSVAFLGSREVKELADILENQYGMMALVSDGWNAFDATPQEAVFEIDGGAVIRAPLHSFHRAGAASVSFAGDPTGHTYLVSTDAYEGGLPVVAGNNRGVCHRGRCFRLTRAEDGTWNLSGTAYGSNAADLPASLEVQVHRRGEAPLLKGGTLSLPLDPQVAAVFAQGVGFSENPVGLGLTGRVALRGAPNPKGKAPTLAQGKLRAQFAVNEGNDLALASGRKNAQGTVVGTPFKIADILVEGRTQGGPVTIVPPVVVYMSVTANGEVSVTANGKGTRNVATAGTASPQLL